MEWLNTKLAWFDRDDNRRKIGRYGLAALGTLVLAIIVGSLISPARADGPARKGPGIKAADVAPAAKRTWTGLYGGVIGGYAMGELSGPGPIGMSSAGPLAGVCGGATVQTGQIVWGAEACHAWFFGDLKDVGVEREIEYTGRLGVVFGNALLYGHVSFVQLHTKFTDIEGWKFGPGIELKTAAEGWSVDLRGGYAVYDVESMMPGVDANMLWGRVGLVRRFDLPAGWLWQ